MERVFPRSVDNIGMRQADEVGALMRLVGRWLPKIGAGEEGSEIRSGRHGRLEVLVGLMDNDRSTSSLGVGGTGLDNGRGFFVDGLGGPDDCAKAGTRDRSIYTLQLGVAGYRPLFYRCRCR